MLGTIEKMFRLHAIHKHVNKYPELCTGLCLGYKLMLGSTCGLCYLSLAAIRFRIFLIFKLYNVIIFSQVNLLKLVTYLHFILNIFNILEALLF